MSDITVYILPDTLAKESILHPLVHTFPSIVYLRAVEDDPGADFSDNPWIQSLFNDNRLNLHAPAPLGEDRDRFLALINDIENRRADYAAMLSNLALAHIGSGNQTESKQSIISRLVDSAGGKAPKADAMEMLLWQARLVLKLGELFEREQQDIAGSLAELARKQETLFAELREETNEPFALTREIGDAVRGSDEMLDHRLKAWAQLFCLGGNKVQASSMFFITPRLETLEKIKDQYESSCNLPCPQAVSFDLPLVSAGEEENETFFPPAPSAALVKLCTRLLAGDLTEESKGNLLDVWEQELEKIRQSPRYHEGAKVRLTLQPFDGVSWERLLLETFSRTTAAPESDGEMNQRFVIGALEVI